MINDISELNLEQTDDLEAINLKVKEKLGVEISTMIDKLSEYVKEKAEVLSNKFINIIAYGDYSRILESQSDIINFLKDEASKPENWKMIYVAPYEDTDLIQFAFDNSSIDDGDVFQGFVFLSKSGKIRHFFAQLN